MEPERRGGSAAPCTIVIPARFQSSRYPGKPLAALRGTGGESASLIERSWRAASLVEAADRVLVATDDSRIADEVERFGGQAVMTPAGCRNGTERCAAVAEALGEDGIIVNFQGDALLTPPEMVDSLVRRMRSDPDLPVATPAIRCSRETHAHLLADRAAGRVGGTTVVVGGGGDALYFSKQVIPFVPDEWAGPLPVHLHLGIYAYRRSALDAYSGLEPGELEIAEGLEQLRFLDAGIRIGAVVSDPPEGVLVELNNPTDVPLIEAELRRRGTA